MRHYKSAQFGVATDKEVGLLSKAMSESASVVGNSATPGKARARPIILLIVSGIVLVAAIVLGTALLASKFRERALANNERELKNTALILAEQTDRVFQAIELVQISLIERMQSLGISSSEDYERQMSTQDVHQMLRDKISGLPHVDAITLINSDGKLINFSRNWPIPAINVADRDYFKALKSGTQLTSFISEPVHSRATGTWTVYLARKLTGPNGEFLGLTLGAMKLAYFEKFFGSIALGKDAAISLFRRDGTLLARHPHIDSAIGLNYIQGPLFQNILTRTDHGSMRLTSRIDEEDRLIAAHSASHFPVVVMVATTVSAALAGSQEEVRYLLVAGVLATLLTGAIVFFVTRELLKGRKRFRQDISEKRLQLSAALNNMSQGLCMFDSTARLILCNDRYLQLYGLSHEGVKPGLTLRNLIDHRKKLGSFLGDPEQFCANIIATVSQGKIASQSLDTCDGRTIRITDHPMANGGWVSTHEDITDQAMTETFLRESEARFAELFESAPDGLMLCDHKGVIQLVNGEANRIFGYDLDELVGKTIEMLIPEDLRERHLGLRSEFNKNPNRRAMGKAQQELKGLRKDGSVFPADICVSPLMTNGERMFCAIVRDITDRRQLEEERNHNRELLNLIIESVPSTIVLKDARDFRYVLINRAGEKYYGIPRDQMIGRTAYDVLPKESADRITNLDRQSLKAGSQLIVDEHVLTNPSRGTRTAISNRRCILGDDGKPAYLLAVADDVTERKVTEQQLQQAQKMEAVGNLTGGVAHDFNNLLTIIIGNLDLLQDDVVDNPAAQHKVETILQASLRGADLARQMLAFSRRQPLQPKRIDVNEHLSRTVQLLTRTLGENVRIDLRLGADSWPVLVDQSQLEAAVVNIAINARDAMPRGGILTLETEKLHVDRDNVALSQVMSSGDYMIIKICDTGTGIPPDVLARVFEPFFTTKDPGKGTGLGLSMVYGFIKQSGGHITVDSEVGKGTTFKLYLPRAVETDAQSYREESVAESQAPLTAGKVILAVDDNPVVRATVVAQLKEFGYEVIEADNAQAALEKLDGNEKVDLLFTDIVMPGGINGKELADKARAMHPNLKVLFTSGFPGAGLNDNIEFAEDEILLSKPYRKRDLALAIGKVLART